jgi:uncharacterized protein YndB with AHSA1/START domain
LFNSQLLAVEAKAAPGGGRCWPGHAGPQAAGLEATKGEITMASAYTATAVIKAAPERVFDYVRQPENQPRWAVNFVRSTRPLGDGRYVMQTPFGELTYRVDADAARGTVDFVIQSDYGDSVLPARVVAADPAGSASIFTFTISRTPDMDDPAWEGGKRGMDEELELLKQLLETA